MGKLDDLHTRLESLEQGIIDSQNAEYNPAELNGKTRSKVAMTFVYGFFCLTAGTLIFTMVYNSLLAGLCDENNLCFERMLDVKDMLLAVVGYIGSPLGFIMGFYFKGKFED